MVYSYTPKGVCARRIDVDIEDGIIRDVSFTGGCDGNHKGITKLCIGRTAEEVSELLSGIRCGMRSTSCPDQLSQALKAYLER